MLLMFVLWIFSTSLTASTKSWHFEEALKPDRYTKPAGGYVLIPAGREDFQKVLACYQHHPVPGHDIASVQIIYSPNQNMMFSRMLFLLRERHSNPAFKPNWSNESNPTLRAAVDRHLKTLSGPHVDASCPNVQLLPLWHGTRPELLDSIFKMGFANLAITDEGFFGKGLYSAHEAEYAYRVYSKGALLLNWVALYSAYPVIEGDMSKLQGKGNYANYDAHFIPVRPENPMKPDEVIYLPCGPGQRPTYTEVVVFQGAQCLPRYVVTLQPAGLAIQVPPPVSGGIPSWITRPQDQEIYRRMVKCQLVYTDPDTEIETVLRIPVGADPLNYTFDLSRCGGSSKYLSINTGYRKEIKAENAGKWEAWVTPRFFIEKNLNGSAAHYRPIMGWWDGAAAPFGLFWTYGSWSNERYGCFTTNSLDQIGDSLYDRCAWYGEQADASARVKFAFMGPHWSAFTFHM